mgnify:CR=1 FL=1
MATTTIDTDTELSAVNAILGAIGQSPISQLKDPSTGVIANANPEIQLYITYYVMLMLTHRQKAGTLTENVM